MTAAAFLATFNARFACSVNLFSGHEFDQIGRTQAKGNVCADCRGCETRSGNMGLADTGFSLERKAGLLHLVWACPSCGHNVSEETSLLSAEMDAHTISKDALCFSCRKQIARTSADKEDI